MLPWLLWSILWLQVSDYSKLSYYNWIEWLVKSKAANALFIFDEIVMVIKIHLENGGTLLFLLQRLLHKENEVECIPIIEQIKQMDYIVTILMNWSQLIDNVKYCLQNRITSRLFYGGSIQINNFQAFGLIFSQKTWFQYFPASIYMSNFLVIINSRESCSDRAILWKCSP